MRIKAAGVPLINRIREYEDTDNWTIPFVSLVFTFIHMQFIRLRPCILSLVSELAFPPKKKGIRLSTTRHNYARSGKKICKRLYSFKGMFFVAINLTKKTL